MEKESKILDRFGSLVIRYIYDEGMKDINNVLDVGTRYDKEVSEILDKLNLKEKTILKNYLSMLISTNIFSFLSLFEENTDFKIYHESNEAKQNLVEISEMLKAEIHGKDGWVEKFSKYKGYRTF